jgi:hypothetical protein
MERTKEKIGADKGLISFRKETHNPVLWGHYADRHRGVVLGFDIPDERCQHASYQDEFLDMEFDKNTGIPTVEFVDKMHSTKKVNAYFNGNTAKLLGTQKDVI